MKSAKKAAACLLMLVMALGLLPGFQSGSANGREEQDAPASDRVINGARVVVDGIVHTADIYVRGGKWLLPAEDAEAVLGSPAEDAYVDLDDYARSQDISCEFDETLNAVYLSTWSSYGEKSGSADFDRAFQLGLVPDEWRDRAEETIESRDYRSILASVVERLAPDQMAVFDENVTDYDTSMTRGMGFVMVYYASKCLGANTFNNDFDDTRVDGDDLWGPISEEEFLKLFPHGEEGPEICGDMEWASPMTAAYLYSFWHSSPVSGYLIFDFEEETGRMRPGDRLTVEEAVSAATRLYDSVPQYVSLDDPRAAAPDEAFLTAEHMKAAGQRGPVTSEDHPVWTGFIFDTPHAFDVSPDQLKQSANFGFNSARINVKYEYLFNEDVTQAKLSGLQTLDNLVAAAIAYNLHLNICFTSLPGRTASTDLADYTSQGDFDLFLNPEKQERADRLWALIAERYRDVPSAVLSFTPFFEALNKNLSTGLPVEDYGPEDVGRYLAHVIRVIREADPDRLVIYEPDASTLPDEIVRDDQAALAAAGGLENTIISYNFCEQSYVYASMTAAEGENIDTNNHSIFPPEYPTYIYSVGSYISAGTPVTIDGLLPEGTQFDLYLRDAWGGELTIAADGEVLYQETMERADYECGEMVSYVYPYAVSEKKISVTIPADTDELRLTCSGEGPSGNGVHISGMDLYLPEEYAQERWYFGSGYDVFLGTETQEGIRKVKTSRVMICPNTDTEGAHITVRDDLTYTTESIMSESSADTIRAWGDGIDAFDGNCVVRYETARFGGTAWSSMEAYYRDLLSMFTEHGFSWWSNDWSTLVTDTSSQLGGVPMVSYGGYSAFNLELLKLLQQYQCSDR